MLTKFEIDAQYYKLSKYFIDRAEKPVNTADASLSFLLDSKFRLVAISRNPMTCKALACFDKIFAVNLYDKSKQQVVNLNVSRNECWKLSLNVACDRVEENLQIETIEELKEYFLIGQKAAALDYVYTILDYKRKPMRQGLTGQDFIYFSKYLEAKEILKNNVEVDLDLEYPYTTGYAHVMGLTLQQSASAICLQHDSQAGFLAEGENVRIKYKNIIINETDITKLKSHLENFMTEHEKYSHL
jgi:hypothetical protein